MLQKISVSNKCSSFERSLYQRILHRSDHSRISYRINAKLYLSMEVIQCSHQASVLFEASSCAVVMSAERCPSVGLQCSVSRAAVLMRCSGMTGGLTHAHTHIQYTDTLTEQLQQQMQYNLIVCLSEPLLMYMTSQKFGIIKIFSLKLHNIVKTVKYYYDLI